MPRGKASAVGDTRVAKNGYHYTKMPDGKWKLTHWITAEKKLGRPLEENEMAKFVDSKYKADPYDPDGIIVIKKRTSSLRKRRAQIQERIRELEAELKAINAQIGDS